MNGATMAMFLLSRGDIWSTRLGRWGWIRGGDLVMQTRWGKVMDVKVQRFRGRESITFWHGTDNGTFGEGYYVMVSRLPCVEDLTDGEVQLDEAYEVFKTVASVGAFSGDLH